jgi:homoserine O-acetyltransferase/O-succinyltransferase
MIGPGKAIDTDQFFVIGHNVLGGCQGTTGPASLDSDGKTYGSKFPRITIMDMVDVQERLLSHLGISRLMGTAGGSMGGMISLEWARRNQVQKAFITASCAAHSPMQIGFNESARQAIMRDPKYMGGDYGDDPPRHGLSVARMIGHISYLSTHSFDMKFGRNYQEDKPGLFQVESYLNYQGDKFTYRFDANSLIVLSRAIDDYECASLAGSETKFSIVSYSSDWLYTPAQGESLHQMALAAGLDSEYHLLDMPFGHDSFLLDGDLQAVHARKLWAS